MGMPYVGEIRMFGGNFAPNGWMLCNGQLIPIAENEVLFDLIGTTYGGDGQSTYALPNLQSRVPIHQGTSTFGTPYVQGELGGLEAVTLLTAQIPSHFHQGIGTTDAGTSADPTGGVWASTPQLPYHEFTESEVALASDDVSLAGSSQPHDNMVPFTVINFIISMFGVFPSQG